MFGIQISTMARFCFAAGIVAVVVGSLGPQAAIMPFHWSDKVVHVFAYGVLGLSGAIGYPDRRATPLLIVGLIVLGGAIEAAQDYVPGRHGSLLDIAANIIGIALGVIGGRRFTGRS